MKKCPFLKAFRFIVLCWGAGIFVTGCATVPRDSAVKEVALQELCDRYQLPLQWDTVSQVVTLSDGQVKARILVGSDVVVFQEERINLSSPVRRSKNMILVPADFEEKILKRFKAAVPLFRFKKIVVDAGHGGKDPGAIGRSGVREKDVVLEIARRVKELLAGSDIDVVMTRDRDEFISLEGRTEIASRAEADLFVSIHANSNPSKNIDGLEVYYIEELGRKDKQEDQRQKNHRILFEELNMDHGSMDVKRIVSDLLYTYKQQESRALAQSLAKGIASYVGMTGRGDRTARFFVLRNTLVPAVLIEVGYLSNAQEEKLLASSDYRRKLADGIAKAILDYGKK